MKSSQDSSKNSILYLLASLILLVLLAWVFLLGISTFYSYKTKSYINKWIDQDASPLSSEIEEALGTINTAISIYNKNPEYFRLKALVIEQDTKGKAVWDSGTKSQLQQALQLYKKAIALRPSWPYSWAGMARMKLKMLEIDNEFESALINMAKLGPWESRINLTIIELGFITWGQLSIPAQDLVEAAIKRGLISQKTSLHLLARRHNKESLVSTLEKQMNR
ncbi:MAG: hypothetical protein OEW89_06230 [Gammaproteobacteria bacterium]|nr:hypothetical protein [Gammaproteobacteria bacterium]MDH5593485.1 hypothetical protein [Gammaproteobacteria bacterium]